MRNKKKFWCLIASIFFINNVQENGPKNKIHVHIVEQIKKIIKSELYILYI